MKNFSTKTRKVLKMSHIKAYKVDQMFCNTPYWCISMSKLENSTQQSTFILSVYLHSVYSIYRAYLDLDISMVTCPLATGTLLFILHTPLTRHIVLLDPDMWLHSGFSRVKFLLSWITNLHCYLYALDTSLYCRIFLFFECGMYFMGLLLFCNI